MCTILVLERNKEKYYHTTRENHFFNYLDFYVRGLRGKLD